ncbi:MAG: DUF4010 domain-containing protein [Rhodospirillaceae bacterium]|nr:DUF4010 domain-containing protein [Rhodospirillaceae bacterium]
MLPLNPEFELAARLALALGIGLMFGVERGWRQRERPQGTRAAGIRTFTLIGLLGGGAGLLGREIGDGFIIAAFAALAVLFVAAYMKGLGEEDAPARDRSITTAVAALVCFVLAVTAVRADMVLAAAAATVAVAVLDLRETLHGWIARVEKAELSAAIKLLLISVVVLPVLPDRGYGPGGALNPFELWWLVVLVAGISFAGHAAMRIAGPHAGLVWTGVLGGLASSTAVTISCARLAVAHPGLGPAPAAGIAAAAAVSMARTLVLSVILFPAAAPRIAPPLVLAAAASTGLAVALIRRTPTRTGVAGPTIAPGPPPDLGLPVKFGLFLAVFSLAAFYARELFGDAGVLAASALSGLIDVDAVTVSLSRQGVAGQLGVGAIAAGIVVAIAVNSAVKAAYAVAIAGRLLLVPMAAMAALAVAGLAAGWAMGALS